jgi:hypothetical protein
MMLNNNPAVRVETATWNAVDVKCSLANVETDEGRECHVLAHREAGGVLSNKQRSSSISDLIDPGNSLLAGRRLSKTEGSADTGMCATRTF